MVLIKLLAFPISFLLYWAVSQIREQHGTLKKQLKSHYLPLMHNLMMEYTDYHKYKPAYNETLLNMIDDPGYCLESDSLKLMHPDIVYQDRYIFRDIERGNLQREIIKKRAFDAIQGLVPSSKPTKKFQHRIPPQLTYLYTFKPKLWDYYPMGESLGCLFQKFNHVPGMFSLISKNYLLYTFTKYVAEMKERNVPQECISNASYLPQSFRLNVEKECKSFFAMLRKTNNSAGPEFLLKTDQHRGEGIRLLFKSQIQNITAVYQWGQLCGEVKEKIIAQRYINKPFLYKGHKIEFRIYVYVASTRPLQVYMYKRALIKRCATEYNPLSEEISAHVCNTAVTEKTIAHSEDSEATDEEEELFIDWDLDGIEKLLKEQGRVSEGWLERELYPRIKTKLIHTIRSGQGSFSYDTRFAEFLAVDFLLDDTLDVWLLELNYNPQILSVTEDRIKRNYKMIEDTLEIAFAYIRSKFKRIKHFLETDLMQQTYSGNRIRQTDFNKKYTDKVLDLLYDQIDRKFKVSIENLYTHIIDESRVGTDQYFNLIDADCIM